MIRDADLLVEHALKKDKQVFKELLTTDKVFVNTRYDSNKKEITRYEQNGSIHLSYSLPPDWKWTEDQPVEMPSGTRAGILTQPSWLVAWSMNQDNHAILRGKWVRERLLGNVVPDIPITVDAQLPEAGQERGSGGHGHLRVSVLSRFSCGGFPVSSPPGFRLT